MNIGESIRKLRKGIAKRQSLFAKDIGITQTYLSQIENDHKKPSTEVLQKIANHLDIPLAILFWFGIEEKDVKPNVRTHFKFLKPIIDKMLMSLFLTH